ncbi:MAG TPA: TonB-dependent receptor [Candidatus Aminicenantes bacterium]|nr:TonB-dependent receptor [Candidatus Aminicenantes bacterium]HRY64256.1 TonB-dependent receptor [Candidatus Aminicenantes bacterium]HRZ71169.1 TonB-dependent receptor [Candidatus Aminicenantes bacterium]
MFRRTIALAALAALLSSSLPAQDPQSQTGTPLRHDVVVTATRLETPEKKVGSSLSVVSGEELVRTGRTFVLDALEAVLGLSAVRNGGPGATSSVSIRGANSEHTLFLLDGLEINDPINPSRSFDISHLPLGQVERIEILRGPQGLLYGSDALGGVINIITRTGRGRPRLTLASAADTLRSAAADVSLAGSGAKTEYSFGLFHERTAGVSAASSAYAGNTEKDGYRNLDLSARVGYAPRPAARLTLTVRASRARTELDNFGGPGGDDPNSVQTYGSLLVHGQYRDLAGGGRWERTLSLSWLGARRDNANGFDAAHPDERDEGLYRSGLLKLDWQNNIRLGHSHTLTAGLEAEEETGRSAYVSESAYGPYESSFPSARARTAGVYVLDHWEVRDRFFVTAGVRADRHSRAGTAVTFRVAPAFVLAASGTRFKASVGTGFKSPSLYQLFAPPTSFGPVGNPGLRPERALGWDAGIEQRLAAGRVVLGLTWFENSFRDLVDFDYAAGYVNIGRARTKGLEAEAEFRPAGGARLRASYARLSARDKDSGAELLRRPRDKFSAEAGFRPFGRFDLAAEVVWVGRRLDRDYGAYPYPVVALPGYVLLDAVLTAPVGRRIELFVRVDNLLDARAETVWGYGWPGRVARTGLRLTI